MKCMYRLSGGLWKQNSLSFHPHHIRHPDDLGSLCSRTCLEPSFRVPGHWRLVQSYSEGYIEFTNWIRSLQSAFVCVIWNLFNIHRCSERVRGGCGNPHHNCLDASDCQIRRDSCFV